MALTVTLVPGHVVVEGVEQTAAMLNALGRPVLVVEGTIGASEIADGSISFAKLNPNFIIGGTVGSDVSFSDFVIFGDVSAGATRVMTLGNFYNALLGTTVTTFGNIAIDTITYYDLGAGAPRRLTLANFLEQCVTQPADLTTTAAGDRVLVADISEADGSQAKSVQISKLLPVIHSGYDVNPVSGVVVNNQGLVTGLTSDVSALKKTEAIALPTAAGDANATSMSHTFGRIPDLVLVRLQCQTTDAGWDAGDEIDIGAVLWDSGGGSDLNHPYIVKAESAAVKIIRPIGTSGGFIAHKDTGADTAFTPANWKAYVIAWK